MAFENGATDSDIYGFWRDNYRPGYVQQKGGLHLTPTEEANSARYFHTDGWRVRALWPIWVASEHFQDLTIPEQVEAKASQFVQDTKKVADDVGKGVQQTAAAAGDAAGKLLKGDLKGAGQTGDAWLKQQQDNAKNLGRDLGAETEHLADSLNQLGQDIAKGVPGAEASFMALAKGMDPAHVVELVQAQLSNVRSQVETTLRKNWGTLTWKGKRYAWDDAKKSASGLVWYLGVLALQQGDHFKDTLARDLGLHFADGRLSIDFANFSQHHRARGIRGAEGETFGVIPILAIAVIILIIVVLAAVIVQKLDAPPAMAQSPKADPASPQYDPASPEAKAREAWLQTPEGKAWAVANGVAGVADPLLNKVAGLPGGVPPPGPVGPPMPIAEEKVGHSSPMVTILVIGLALFLVYLVTADE